MCVNNEGFWGAMASIEGSIQSLAETVELQRQRADIAEAKLADIRRQVEGYRSTYAPISSGPAPEFPLANRLLAILNG